MCLYVYVLNCSQTVSIKYTSGEVCKAKKSWQGGRFFEHWFAGSGARKPLQELECSALDNCFLAFQGSQLQVSLCSTIKKPV